VTTGVEAPTLVLWVHANNCYAWDEVDTACILSGEKATELTLLEYLLYYIVARTAFGQIGLGLWVSSFARPRSPPNCCEDFCSRGSLLVVLAAANQRGPFPKICQYFHFFET
jgi:hypothetical protein